MQKMNSRNSMRKVQVSLVNERQKSATENSFVSVTHDCKVDDDISHKVVFYNLPSETYEKPRPSPSSSCGSTPYSSRIIPSLVSRIQFSHRRSRLLTSLREAILRHARKLDEVK